MALIVLADDHGRGRANAVVIAAKVFPLETDPVGCVRESLARLSRINFVHLYTVRGQHYYLIRNWAKHQRVDKQGKPRFPGPDESDAQPPNDPQTGPPDTPTPPQSRDSRETLGPDLGSVGSMEHRNVGASDARARDTVTDRKVVPIGRLADRVPSDPQDAQRVLTAMLDGAWSELKASPGMGSGGERAVRDAAHYVWEAAEADGKRWQDLARRFVATWIADPYLRDNRIKGHPAENFAKRVRGMYEDLASEPAPDPMRERYRGLLTELDRAEARGDFGRMKTLRAEIDALADQSRKRKL